MPTRPLESGSENNESTLSRRDFVLGALGLGIGAAVTAGVQQVMKVDKRAEGHAKMLAKFNQSGRNIECSDQFVEELVRRECEARAMNTEDTELTIQRVLTELRKVQNRFSIDSLKEPQKEGEDFTVRIVTAVKQAVEKTYRPDMVYQEGNDTLGDLANGRLQCNSATINYLIALKRIAGNLPDGAKIVCVYSAPNQVPHIQPGFITKDGMIFVMEMTTPGSAPVFIGDDPDNMTVVSADEVLAERGLNLPVSEQQPPLIDNSHGNRGPISGATPATIGDRFAFGSKPMEKGERQLQTVSPELARAQNIQSNKIVELSKKLPDDMKPVFNEYLHRYLAYSNKTLTEVQQAVGRRSEWGQASDDELVKRLSACRDILSPFRENVQKEGTDLQSLSLLAAAKVKNADKILLLEKQKEGNVGRLYSLDEVLAENAFRANFTKERAAVDPVYATEFEIEVIHADLVDFIGQHRPAAWKKYILESR